MSEEERELEELLARRRLRLRQKARERRGTSPGPRPRQPRSRPARDEHIMNVLAAINLTVLSGPRDWPIPVVPMPDVNASCIEDVDGWTAAVREDLADAGLIPPVPRVSGTEHGLFLGHLSATDRDMGQPKTRRGQ